jgi:hypothetical protein
MAMVSSGGVLNVGAAPPVLATSLQSCTQTAGGHLELRSLPDGKSADSRRHSIHRVGRAAGEVRDTLPGSGFK